MKSKPEKLMFRIVKGGLEPADNYSREKMRSRGYHLNDLVAGVITKPRHPGFHRFAHQLGTLVAENIEDFSGMQSHACLKRLQLEARIECDEIGYKFHGMPVTQFIPRSLSFESMDDGTFHEVMRALCEYISKTYWPSVSSQEIEQMAKMMESVA